MAAVDAARGEAEPPPELSIALNCLHWECLPDAGGYLDQDYSLMRRMNTSLNVYNVVKKWYSLTGKQVHSLSDDERRVLRWLKDMEIMFL